jgi:hypothetical protein
MHLQLRLEILEATLADDKRSRVDRFGADRIGLPGFRLRDILELSQGEPLRRTSVEAGDIAGAGEIAPAGASVFGCHRNLQRNSDDRHVLNTAVLLTGAVSRTMSHGSCNCGVGRAADCVARHCW